MRCASWHRLSTTVFSLAVVSALCACGSSSNGDGDGDAGADVDAANGGCVPKTCAELGWSCGTLVTCGDLHDCADEGLECESGLACRGGVGGEPTECVAGLPCEVCDAIPDCTGQPQPTRLIGRVITPGRADGDTANQVGVPNALVYILRTADANDLPAIPSGIPAGGASCDQCDEQAQYLGPVLAGAVTDATGHFTIEEQIPVGVDFLLVVKAGKFRRAIIQNVASTDACTDVTLLEGLPDNPTHLPRTTSDGLAVNFPRIAVSTGQIDAMECVLEKIGIDHGEFGNFGGAAHIDLYRGGASGSPAGSRIDSNTPYDQTLYGSISRLENYDIVVADCEGGSWDSTFAQRTASGGNVLDYVNRGGRLFASHLSFSWLHGNGTTAYDPATPAATGLGPAATWQSSAVTSLSTGTGKIAIGRPSASPRIDHFAAWMDSEGVASSPGFQFPITEPRSQVTALGAGAEEFVYCEGGDCSGGSVRTQQFSFYTPYGAPVEAGCGRVAYSGFHVVAGGGTSPYATSIFPAHCTGDLSDQEKVLLYMLFDLGTCVGNPLPPPCVPVACDSEACGYAPDGCGGIQDCGPCIIE